MNNEREKISECVRRYGVPIAYSPLYKYAYEMEQYLRKRHRRKSWMY